MFRKQRLQVIDLGAHLVKALVLEPGPDGRLTLVAAEVRALPDPLADPDQHVEQVDRQIKSLAATTLVRTAPVHVLAGETLIRSHIGSLSGVPETALADVIQTDRARFLRTYGTRQRIFASSVRVKLARSGETVDVTLAHAYARWIDLERLHHQLRSHGLELGSVVPRALAFRELVRRVAPFPGHVVIAEMGFTATTLLRLDDGEPRRWKLAFAGGADVFRDIAGQLQRDQPLDGPTFQSVMTRTGFTGDERRLADSGLSEMEARGAARALRERAAPLFSALSRGCDALFDDPSPEPRPAPVPAFDDPDQPADLAPKPARSEPAPEAPPPFRVLFTGGLSLVPGFLDAARVHLGGSADLLPMDGAIDTAARPPSAPLELFAACCGAARLLVTPDAATGDVAREYVALLAAQDAAAEHWTLLNPRLIRSLAAACVLLIAVTALWTRSLASRIDDLSAAITTERASLESPNSMKTLLDRFREIRVKEALVDTRVHYVRELVAHRPDWAAIVARIGALAPPKSIAITDLTLELHWPRNDAPDLEAKRPADTKYLEVRLAGEADSLDTFRKFVADLDAQKVLTDLTYDSSARTAEGKSHGLEHHAYFAFTVSGLGDISKNAEP